MSAHPGIFIVGGGAIGFPLAAHLQAAGRAVTVLRVQDGSAQPTTQTIVVRSGEGTELKQAIACRPLAQMPTIGGLVVLATKANANERLAQTLAAHAPAIDLVVMQNGIGVERPFLGRQFRSLARCVVYITAEKIGPQRYTARMVKPSPIGLIETGGKPAADVVAALSTPGLAFCAQPEIVREVWKKGVINTVFNSICPLMEADNGIFERDAAIMDLARQVVHECVPVANRLGIALDAQEIVEQILSISRKSSGQLISTLQDIHARRETEIGHFNLEICREAQALTPPLHLALTQALGLLTQGKAAIARQGAPAQAAH